MINSKKLVTYGHTFYLPDGCFAVKRGKFISVYVDNKEIDLRKYKTPKEIEGEVGRFVYMFPFSIDYNYLAGQYEDIGGFLDKKSVLEADCFNKQDEDIVLFSFLPKLDFTSLDMILERIKKTMPFIQSIFLRPVIHLSLEDAVLPVDTVNKVNHLTLQYIARHTEHWKDIEDGEIKPAKLLTSVYDDDYCIYENKVFVDTVDTVLSLLKRYKNIFVDIVYNKLTFELSTIDKTNHLYHYLAIGKLFVGFAKSDQQLADKCNSYIELIDGLTKKLSAGKVRKVYLKNKGARLGRTIQKTNILAMHKDYRHIYSLRVNINKTENNLSRKRTDNYDLGFQKNYESYTWLLTVFALQHFRFSLDSTKIYENGKFLDCGLSFSKWEVKLCEREIKCLACNAVDMTIKCGQSTYTTLLIPMTSIMNGDDKQTLGEVISTVNDEWHSDKYIFLTPVKPQELVIYSSSEGINYGILYLSISDLNSFRRIQRLAMQAMVNCSHVYDICPFCGSEFIKEENKYSCNKCKTELIEEICSHCGSSYTYSTINYPLMKNKVIDKKNYMAADAWQYYIDKDSFLNYRNITELTDYGKPICPDCKN